MSDPLLPVDDASDPPLSRARVLEDEYRALHPRAPAVSGTIPDDAAYDVLDGVLEDDVPDAGRSPEGASVERLREAYQRMHGAGHAALCLSGGGIRSASFALGVIQGLAERKLLSGFDYLSTVSGGGFAGGWLSAWLHHAEKDGNRETVLRQLQGTGLPRGATEPAPVSRMRSYSRYMSPQLGSLSADSWTLVSTVLRNVLLNWLVLLPLVAAALLVPRAYLEAVQYFDQPIVANGRLSAIEVILLAVSIGLIVASLAFVVTDLPSYGNRKRSQAMFLACSLGPLWLGTLGLTVLWAASVVRPSFTLTLGAAVVVNVATWMVFGFVAGTRKWRPRTWLGAALCAPIPSAGIWWLTNGPFGDGVELGQFYCTVALPLLFSFMALMLVLFIALASADQSDADLEWHARYGGWILITIVVWLAVTSVVFYAPDVFRSIRAFVHTRLAISDLSATGLLGAAEWLLGAVVAYMLRQRPASSDNPKASALVTTALLLAAPAFLVLLLGAIAWINVAAMDGLYAMGVLSWLQFTPGGHGVDDVTGAEVLAVAGLLVGLGLLMARLVPVNKFSLHGMYRERLVRAFLGASRPAGDRQPNPFTGFDPRDNLAMAELTGRPLHIVNTTLNLVAEKGLAMQFRKAESFTVSPLHAGSASLDAYRPSRQYADESVGGTGSGISLGTAMAISGAAASPNMGARSSGPVTFLMTLFNARLGVWLGNPGPSGEATWQRSEPKLGVGPMLRELLGLTTDRNPYVYLSDGGHFENLGLWEMVMRRCTMILVSDAGCDQRYTFGDLANAVRLIRIDLGVPIVFDGGMAIDGEPGPENRHFAIGRVKYSAMDGALAEDGILVYVKATLAGDEPVDVKTYAKARQDFPHESTSDQWFTEAQFESYRLLGLTSVASIAPDFDGRGGVREFFDAARVGATAMGSPRHPAMQSFLGGPALS